MVKLNPVSKRNPRRIYFWLGVLLSGPMVVADDVKLATGQHASADLVRRVTRTSSPASATEAASATTPGTNHIAAPIGGMTLPPVPADVTELRFNEFFRQPIGPRGLEFSEKLQELDGGRIRILGYMVRQTKPMERGFLLAPVPITLNEIEYGHADDLPATTMHVLTATEAPAQTPFTPGPLLLTGTLKVGNRLEADGRVSTVRLELDPPTAAQQRALEEISAASKQSKKPARPHEHDHHGHAH